MNCCDSQNTNDETQHYDLKPRRSGDTWKGVVFSIEINGEPADLSGAIVEMTFKKLTRDAIEWLISSETGGITVNANEITILPRLLVLPPTTYKYTLQVTYPGNPNIVRTYLTGLFKVTKD